MTVFASGTCSGTDGLLEAICDFIDAETLNFTVIRRAATPSSSAGNLQLLHANWDMWQDCAGLIDYRRQKMYTIQHGAVEIWLIADMAYVGNPNPGNDYLNQGIFAYLTETTVTPDGFKGLYADGVSGANPNTAPRLSIVSPAYGATDYVIRSDGDRIHVSFKRSTSGGDAWQHFSFGSIEKADSWVGGEYFSGCAGGSILADWDYAVTPGGYATNNSNLLSSAGYRTNRYLLTDSQGPHPYGKGIIRVVGAKLGFSPYAATKWCVIGDPVTGQISESSATGRNELVGSVGVMNALSCYQGIASRVCTDLANSRALLDLSANDWDKRSVGLVPDLFIFDYQTPSVGWQYLGSIPGIRFINIEFIADGATVNNDWHCYPVSNRYGSSPVYGEHGFLGSGNLGIAFKFQDPP